MIEGSPESIYLHAILETRKQLGDHNDNDQPLEWCVQNMRLEVERLRKNIIEANQEIAITNNLVEAQRISIDKQKKEIKELNDACNSIEWP